MVEKNLQEILSNPVYSTLIRGKLKNKDFKEKLKMFSGFYNEKAIHWAALGDRTLLIDLLHNLNMNPNELDGFGKTPLDWIIERNIKIHTTDSASFQKRAACRKMSDDTAMALWNYGGRHSGYFKEKIPYNLCGWIFTGNLSFSHLLLEQVFYKNENIEQENNYTFLTGYNGMNVFHYLSRTPTDVRQDYIYNFIEEFIKINFKFNRHIKEEKNKFLNFINVRNKKEDSEIQKNQENNFFGFELLNKKDNDGRTPLWHLVDAYLAMPENLKSQHQIWKERISMYINFGSIIDVKDNDNLNCIDWCNEVENVSFEHKKNVYEAILNPVKIDHLKEKMFQKENKKGR